MSDVYIAEFHKDAREVGKNNMIKLLAYTTLAIALLFGAEHLGWIQTGKYLTALPRPTWEAAAPTTPSDGDAAKLTDRVSLSTGVK